MSDSGPPERAERGRGGAALVALGAMCWGLDGSLRRPLVGLLAAPSIVLWEHLVLAVYSLPVLARRRAEIARLTGREWLGVLVIAWGGSALATVLFTQAFVAGNPTSVLLLQKAQPLFALVVAHQLCGERLGRAFWPLAALALVGAYLVSFGDLGPFAALPNASLVSALLALGAAAIWGACTAVGRYALSAVGFETLTALRLGLAIPPLLLLALVQPAGLEVPPAAAWPTLVALALLPGLLGLLLYYRGLLRTPASVATFAELAFPITAILVNWLVLGVGITPTQLLGAALLWAAVLTLDHGAIDARAGRAEPALSTAARSDR